MAPKTSTTRSTSKGKGKQKAQDPATSSSSRNVTKEYQPPPPSYASKVLTTSLSTIPKSRALAGCTIFLLGYQDIQPQLEVFVKRHGAVVSRLLLGSNEVTHVVLSEQVWYRRGSKSTDQLLEHILNLNDNNDPESRVWILPLEYIYLVAKKEPVSKKEYDFQLREMAGTEAFVGSDAKLWNIIPLENDQASTSGSRTATGDSTSGNKSGVGSSNSLGDGSQREGYEGNGKGKGKGKAVAFSPRSQRIALSSSPKGSKDQTSRLRRIKAPSSASLTSQPFATSSKAISDPARPKPSTAAFNMDCLTIAYDSDEDLPHPSTLGPSIRQAASTSTSASTSHQPALRTKTNLSSRDGPSEAKLAKIGSVGKSGAGRPLQPDSSLEIVEHNKQKLQPSSSLEIVEPLKPKDRHVKKKKLLDSGSQSRTSAATKTTRRVIRSYSDDDADRY